MSGKVSADDVQWSSTEERVLSLFAKARENTQLHGKFMFSGGWVQYINDKHPAKDGVSVTVKDFDKALRKRYKGGLDNKNDIASPSGIYRDYKKEKNPMTNEGSRTTQWYYAVVAPGDLRPKPKGVAEWSDDVWILPPERTSKRKLDATAGDGADDVQRAKSAKAGKGPTSAPRMSARLNSGKIDSPIAVIAKQIATDDAQSRQRSEGGQYSQDAGKKKARHLPDNGLMSLGNILKEASGFDDLLFPANAEGVISKTVTFGIGDTTLVVLLQQQQEDATFSATDLHDGAAAPAASNLEYAPMKRDNLISWTSARELKMSLRQRSHLTKNETDILRVLSQKQRHRGEDGTETVVVPQGRGQSEPTTYLKLPPTRADHLKENSTKEIAKATSSMAKAIDLELGGVVEYLATQIDGNFIPSPTDGDDEKLTHQSAALMDEANLSFSQYHVIRMFVYRMWKVRIGAPVNYVRDFMSNLCPPTSAHVDQAYLETGAKAKKYQLCTYWYHRTPRDELAAKVLSLLGVNKLLSGTAISAKNNGGRGISEKELAVGINLDKASDRTALMLRILNEKDGNKGENALVIGEMGDGANECYNNLLTCFFALDTHVVKQFLQNLIDDELHLLTFDAKGEGDATTKCCAVIRRDYRHRAIPLPESMEVIEVEGEEYLSSSIDTPDFAPGTEMVILRRRGKAVAVASKRNGSIVAWSTLENASDAKLAGGETVKVTTHTFIGLISVDGKMGATLEGHQGQGCVSPCYGCIALTALMTQGQEYNHEPRTGDYANEKLYCMSEEAMVASFSSKEARLTYLKQKCFGIRHRCLLRCTSKEGIDKHMYGAMHDFQGNFQHFDEILVDELTDIDKASEIQAQAVQVEEHLSKLIKSAESERIKAEYLLAQAKRELERKQIVVAPAGGDRGARTAQSNRRREILSAKKDVEDKERELREIVAYADDLDLGKKDTTAYIAHKTKKRADVRKKRTLAVLILDGCYYESLRP